MTSPHILRLWMRTSVWDNLTPQLTCGRIK